MGMYLRINKGIITTNDGLTIEADTLINKTLNIFKQKEILR